MEVGSPRPGIPFTTVQNCAEKVCPMSRVEVLQNGDLPLLIPVETVAKLLSISPRSVWRWVSSGEMIKPIKLGDSSRWRREEILDWVAAGCPTPGANRNGR